MAGDWIPMQCGLQEKREIMDMAELLGVTINEAIGICYRWFAWVNQHVESCNAASVTTKHINVICCNADAARALETVGWIRTNCNGTEIVNYDRWNSQSAKRRILMARRVAVHRAKKCNAMSVTKALPEKRREEKRSSLPTEEKRRARKACASDDVSLPAEFVGTKAEDAWTEWLAYRRERRLSMAPRTLAKQLAFLAAHGPEVATEIITASILAGWQGLFEPKAQPASGAVQRAAGVPNLREMAKGLFEGKE